MTAADFESTHNNEGWAEGAVRLPQPADPARPLTIVASRSHRTPETDEWIQKVATSQAGVSIVSRGSSLKICMVAEGAADFYPRFAPTMEWDTAAGHAIANAAGYRVTDPATGRELEYNKKNLLNPWFVVGRADAPIEP